MTVIPDPWIATATGGRFDLLSPGKAQVDWRDICHGLANLCRWTGHSIDFYSVAEHSARVALLVEQTDPGNPRAMLYALLHDAHEAYIGDWSSPLKIAVTWLADGRPVAKMLSGMIDAAIFEAFGLAAQMPADIAELIGFADLTLLATEKRDIMQPHEPWQMRLPEPLAGKIVPNSRMAARDNYARLLANAVYASGALLPVRRQNEMVPA